MISDPYSIQIERIRVLNSLGYVHNDLKLENILIGKDDPEVIYLIDFGLSCQYVDEKDVHIEK
jgi:casein kinase 1 epsilon